MALKAEENEIISSVYSPATYDKLAAQTFVEKSRIWEQTTCLRCFDTLTDSHDCHRKNTMRKAMSEAMMADVIRHKPGKDEIANLNMMKTCLNFRTTHYIATLATHRNSSAKVSAKQVGMRERKKKKS